MTTVSKFPLGNRETLTFYIDLKLKWHHRLAILVGFNPSAAGRMILPQGAVIPHGAFELKLEYSTVRWGTNAKREAISPRQPITSVKAEGTK